jgi:hypothetical protein
VGRDPDTGLVGDASKTRDQPDDSFNYVGMGKTRKHVLDVRGEEEEGGVLIIERVDAFKCRC